VVLAAGWLALVALVAGPAAAVAQAPPRAAGKKTPQAEKPGVAGQKPGEKQAEPATPEEAARVLDLRTFPVMEGAKVSLRTLGMLMYEAKGTPKAAFEYQRQQLQKLGFKELPGAHIDAANCSAHFSNQGFHVAASSYELTGDPEKAGWSSVTLVNDGNVAVEKLPVPPGVKPFFPQSYRAAYTTAASPTETAAACRKLLIAAGWEPYGQATSASPDQPDATMRYFKRNAIKLQAWVMTTPAEGGKTLIQYDTELLSADLPAPPDTADPRYDDSEKKLWFESPAAQTDAIIEFYQERLPRQGWKPTSERPIVDDEKKTKFLIYRNSQKDMLSLDTLQYAGKVGVTLRHQSAAEVAEAERLAKAQAEREKKELAEKNKTINVAVPLPPLAKKVDKQAANKFEFTLATGGGPKALETFREHFLKEGWTEEKGRELGKTSGALIFTKGFAKLTLSYFDLGVSTVDITVEGTKNVVLEPVLSKDTPAADAPKPGKKPKAPAVPGLPDLPPGVEVPDEVKDLLNKALQDSDDEKPVPPKKPASKKKSTPKKSAPEADKPAAAPTNAAAPKAAPQDDNSSRRAATEKPLGEYDLSKYNPKKPTFWVSPDGRHVAYLTEKGIVIDGKAREYDYGVEPESFTFSPDSKRTAYAAHVKRPKSDTNFVLVLDGEPGTQAYHHIGPGPVFSPDSKHVAFVGDRYIGGDYNKFVVLDGKEGEPQKGFAWEMAFTADSTRLVYGVEVTGRKTNYMMREQIVDGSQKPVDRAFGPATLHRNFFYGPAGQLGYIGNGGEGQFLIVYDGKEDPNRFREIQIRNVVISDDGKHVAFVAEPASFDSVAVIDGKPGKVYGGFEGDIIPGSLELSPDGSRYGYSVKKSGKAYVVIDGKDGKLYANVGGPVFSPDSKHVAYQAAGGGKLFVVVNGKEGQGYDKLGMPQFSPDSSTVAYWAEAGGKQFVVVNGQKQKAYDRVGTPRFSPDGKRLVYLARGEGKWRLVDAGKEQKAYDDVDGALYFSGDGKRLATIFGDGDKQIVVVDGVEGNRYDSIVTVGGTLHFDAAEASSSGGGPGIHYLATRGNKLLLVEETIQD
jgi:Tol biopolymer transport system component